MIKGLVFDLDGVITDSSEYHYQAWKKLGKEIGVPFDRTFNEQLKGISRMDSLELILQYGGIADKYTLSEKEALAKSKNDYYLTLIEKTTKEDLLEGILPLLQQAREQQLKIALASASKNAPLILNKLGIMDYFDVIVDPATLTNGKPDPEIYIKAAQGLGLLTKDCVGFEDAHSGIEAVNAAGMFSVGIGDSTILGQADYIVSNTEQLNLITVIEKAEQR